MIRPKTILAALSLALAGTLALAALLLAPMAHAGPHSRSSAVVALGDSFISGEGGRWVGNASSDSGDYAGTDRAAFSCEGGDCKHDGALVYGDSYESGCDRSDVAPIKSSNVEADVRFNIACSGADASNLWRDSHGGESHRGEPPQADQLARIAHTRDVRMLIVTVGANDFGFGELVARCAALWTATPDTSPSKCAKENQRRLRERRPEVSERLAKSLRELRKVMTHAGYHRRDYRLTVMGYTSPVPPGPRFRHPERGWSRLRRGRCPFWNSDASWAANRATPFVNRSLRKAALDAGGNYLDVSHSLDSHQLCDKASKRVTNDRPPSESGSEWVRELVVGCCQGRLRESLHPNAYGQRELGRCIALSFERYERQLTCARSGPAIGSSYLVAGRTR